MKIKLIIIVAIVLAMVSCTNKKASPSSESDDSLIVALKDSIKSELYKTEDSEEEVLQTQADINIAAGKGYDEYKESIEEQYQLLITALPQYKNGFNNEKTAWEKYQDAVREVAGYGDYGSSTPMYVTDVLRQGITLRNVSFANLLLYVQDKPISSSKTTFTSAMIADAYTSFMNAGMDVESDDIKMQKRYKASVRKEQKCWNEWMACRESISKKLPDNLRKIYDGCTNMTMRTKLLQLKNQNRNLGMTSGEMLKCALPDNCSDKTLLEYPGFDKVWKKHLNDLD